MAAKFLRKEIILKNPIVDSYMMGYNGHIKWWKEMRCEDLIFEWDEEKNLLNQRKHKVSFETAAYVFEDENYIEMYDFEHSVEEDRYIAIGCVGDVLFVVFTERKEKIRLISARLATESERRLYYDKNIHYK